MGQTSEEEQLIAAAIAMLNSRLPQGWAAERTALSSGNDRSTDAAVSIRTPSGQAGVLLITAKAELGPREADALFSGLTRTLRDASNLQILVVAPWLSPKTRERLRHDRANYLDLTGNAQIELPHPALLLSWDGAERSPKGTKRTGRPTLRGAKALRLVRFLLEARTPFSVGEIAEATGLTAGYVSRLLETLDGHALITRGHRGVVEDVDWVALIRFQAEQYEVFKPDRVRTFVARSSLRETAVQMTRPPSPLAVITGSLAAVELAPVAAPTLLAAYCENIDETARLAGLLPADEGGNVALIRAFDDVLWVGEEYLGGFPCVTPAQLAIDCLSGTGRMPSEGDAVIEWIAESRDARLVPPSSWGVSRGLGARFW